MTTKLQEIADKIADHMTIDPAKGREIADMMEAYETTYAGTFKDLYRKPGFKKLWDAIEEVVNLSYEDN